MRDAEESLNQSSVCYRWNGILNFKENSIYVEPDLVDLYSKQDNKANKPDLNPKIIADKLCAFTVTGISNEPLSSRD